MSHLVILGQKETDLPRLGTCESDWVEKLIVLSKAFNRTEQNRSTGICKYELKVKKKIYIQSEKACT